MHDKRMQKHDDPGAMNNTNSYPRVSLASQPLVGVMPPSLSSAEREGGHEFMTRGLL